MRAVHSRVATGERISGTKCHHKEARMCLFGNLPFPAAVSPSLSLSLCARHGEPDATEIFILFFDDEPARGIYILSALDRRGGLRASDGGKQERRPE